MLSNPKYISKLNLPFESLLIRNGKSDPAFYSSSQQTQKSEETPTPKVDVVIPEAPVSQAVETNSSLVGHFMKGLVSMTS